MEIAGRRALRDLTKVHQIPVPAGLGQGFDGSSARTPGDVQDTKRDNVTQKGTSRPNLKVHQLNR